MSAQAIENMIKKSVYLKKKSEEYLENSYKSANEANKLIVKSFKKIILKSSKLEVYFNDSAPGLACIKILFDKDKYPLICKAIKQIGYIKIDNHAAIRYNKENIYLYIFSAISLKKYIKNNKLNKQIIFKLF